MTETYFYSAYGLTLHLPFPCPVLIPVLRDAIADVRVVFGPVSKELPGATAIKNNWDQVGLPAVF